MSKKIAIIGGSGLDDPDMLQSVHEEELETPYGKPSSPLTFGQIEGCDVVLLSRHGKRHQYSPTQVNNRANIYALQKAGATHILATTACGSLREEIDRGHFVVPDQFIDFTRHRNLSFHDNFNTGTVHVPMADPFDENLRQMLCKTAQELNITCHNQGTVITIEGPRFSTRAESKMFRLWGADIINMSVAPEAILANEARIPYAVVAMATDYDCWKTDEAPVSWEDILRVFGQNAENVTKLLKTVITKI